MKAPAGAKELFRHQPDLSPLPGLVSCRRHRGLRFRLPPAILCGPLPGPALCIFSRLLKERVPICFCWV